MQLLDPARPQNRPGSPMYVSASGKPIAVMPNILLAPGLGPETVVVSVMLLVGPNNARWFETTISTSDLELLWKSWMHNPEEVLAKVFQYDYDPSTSPKESNVLTLGDLFGSDL